MVNFGGYVKALREAETNDAHLFLVQYNVLKDLLFDDESLDQFEKKWTEALESSCADFTEATQSLWRGVFESLKSKNEDIRGAPLGNVLKLYVENFGPDDGQDVLQRMMRIHTAAVTNSEALRKLIKKHDKYHQENPLSATLLPLLYSSTVFTSQAVLEESVATLRSFLAKEEEAMFLPMKRLDSDAAHANIVESRVLELEWLKKLVLSIPTTHLPCLVAHRGFHHIKDRSDKRPLENSLAAYELAWTSGIHLCECDVALTRDEKLVLAHDEDFKRLCLHQSIAGSSVKVSDLTFRELISLPLKSGIRPPLLIDVLRSAHAISDHAKLIIEVKPGNAATASALARMLLRHPELCSCVAMIMSFDAFTMHRLRSELSIVLGSTSAHHHQQQQQQAVSLSTSHRRLMSFDHFGTIGSHSIDHRRLQSENNVDGIGMSLSQVNLAEASVGMDLSQSNLDHTNVDRPEKATTVQELAQLDDPTRQFPKLMLLTVSDPPKKPCEMRVGVNDLSLVDSWLTKEDGSLDGVYLQFQKEMLTESGAALMRELASRYTVGVWGHSGVDPDDWKTFDCLVTQCGCSYVNTDLPNHFRKEIFVRSGTTQ